MSQVWTQERLDRLAEMHRQGASYDEMSEAFGLSLGSIGYAVSALVRQGVLAVRHERPWSDAEKMQAVALRGEGLTNAQIATRMDRTEGAVKRIVRPFIHSGEVARRLSKKECWDNVEIAPIRQGQAKQRKCLHCGTDFLSAWSGHRICGSCKATEEWASSVVTYGAGPGHSPGTRNESSSNA